VLDVAAIERLIAARTATAGMIAKLRACEDALANGADDVVIVDGRDAAALEAAVLGTDAASGFSRTVVRRETQWQR
jgi:acetylglutamate kinase